MVERSSDISRANAITYSFRAVGAATATMAIAIAVF